MIMETKIMNDEDRVKELDKVKKLFQCIWEQDLPGVQAAIDAGVDVNATYGKYQDTPAIVSCVVGHHPILKCLLQNGADPDKQNLLGYGPLWHATAYEQTGCMIVLDQADVDVDALDRDGFTVWDDLVYGGVDAGRKPVKIKQEMVDVLFGIGANRPKKIDSAPRVPSRMEMILLEEEYGHG